MNCWRATSRTSSSGDPQVRAGGIDVSVEDGAVTLSGVVSSHAERWAAVRAAGRVYGVQAIADEIEVRVPDAEGPPPDHLRRRDQLSARRPVPAIGGLDAHQPGLRVRGRVYSPLPNRTAFALLRTHLLCDRPLTGELHATARRSCAPWPEAQLG